MDATRFDDAPADIRTARREGTPYHLAPARLPCTHALPRGTVCPPCGWPMPPRVTMAL